MCRCFEAMVGRCEAGSEVVVAVVDDVGNADGDYTSVVSSGVVGDGDGLVRVLSYDAVCVTNP